MSASRGTVRRVALLSIVAALVVSGYVYRSNVSRNSTLEATKEWARLSDFPPSAKNVAVETSGSMLSREFTVTFTASADDVDRWLNQSPGTANVVPVRQATVRKYNIQPGGGAQHAELRFDEESNTVEIHVYWS